MSSVPQFDPTQSVAEVTIGSSRYLEQDGHRFTYAVHNKGEGRWVPPPQYIYPDQASFDELKDMAIKVLLDSRQLQQSMDRLASAIEKKIGLGGEAPPPVLPPSRGPFLVPHTADLPPLPAEESFEAAEPEVKKKPRAPRKRSGGRPKKVTV